MEQINIGFIGAGNMALAMIKGLLSMNQPAGQIYINDIDTGLLDKRQLELGVNISSKVAVLSQHCQVIILAVKPQYITQICEQLPKNNPCLIVSVAAGVKVQTMADILGKQTAIIRLMPNTPAMLGIGAIGAYANTQTSKAQKAIITQILSSMGLGVWVEDEAKINAITALSGSGPAYFFYIVEAITKQGIILGLTPDDAYRLAVQTAQGASKMMTDLTSNVEQCQDLRAQVTSPNGTTQAAIESFDAQGLDKNLAKGMQAAFDRAIELG